MCNPVLVGVAIGAAVGAATSAATGNDPLMGAVIGGITGGFAPGSVGVSTGLGFTTTAAGVTQVALVPVVSAAGVAGAAAVGLAGGYLMNAMTPETPDYSQYGTGAQPYEYSSQHSTVTGSGGRQAAAVLASEIKQAKSLRKRQAEVADYGLGMDVAGTGLQIA
jgi:hypothetical protein